MYHRCIEATNKVLAKRRAAEDALRIIAQKEAAVAAVAVAQQDAELQAALPVPGMEEVAPLSSSASPASEDAAIPAPAACAAAHVTLHSLLIVKNQQCVVSRWLVSIGNIHDLTFKLETAHK